MESAVISDQVKELIDGCQVRAAVFTTYTFEPDFFELEVIPLLLPNDIPYSTDSRVKAFQVRDALRQAGLLLEVFYDVQVFHKEGQTSPSMDYLCHGVHEGNAAFHPKLNLVLAYCEKRKSEYLLVGAGSNNLSQAGWWDNIECQHWVIVWPDEVDKSILYQFKKDVEFLSKRQQSANVAMNSALTVIANFLQSCRGSTIDKAPAYFGMTKSPRFKSFLRSTTNKCWAYSNWTLEIISPFFADDAHNKEHEFFFQLGVKNIHLLLPKDQEGNALCHPKYFDHIEEQDAIEWAEWSSTTEKTLGLESQTFRRLHAKVYHFYNKKQSWVFVGSVNFTHKAMHDNVEAGFFVKLDRPEPLLKVLTDPKPEGFKLPTDEVPGALGSTDELALPQIHLAYDWLNDSLSANAVTDRSYSIDILTPEGKLAVANWSITGKHNRFNGETDDLKLLLKNGSLVKVAGIDEVTGEPFATHMVMLQQTGWSHKPIEMPDLRAEQILAIYADMSPDRRQLLMMNAMFKQLVLAKEAGEITLLDDDISGEEFFSEYAEIFYAFRRLRLRLHEALDDENLTLVDYYLTGEGMDSLPTLIKHASDESESTVKPITAYLLLLSALEVYQDQAFTNRPLIQAKLKWLKKNIRTLKGSSRIQLETNTPERRKQFFKWFERQFFKQYKTRETQA